MEAAEEHNVDFNSIKSDVNHHTQDFPEFEGRMKQDDISNNSGTTKSKITKVFINKDSITSGLKTHECEFCAKLLTTPQSLKFHLTIHTGEKPFQCQSCDKLFRYSSSLRIHEKSHNGKKPF